MPRKRTLVFGSSPAGLGQEETFAGRRANPFRCRKATDILVAVSHYSLSASPPRASIFYDGKRWLLPLDDNSLAAR